ncbi:MAG: bifunctional diaminohydroxyphosphoribosylaminopyrimidine deaminase/5-amino-6-(5-phosphoribosylamino)uracil reductase RibD [Paraglaciecola sp.]|uniref:bifunctional diaminohydroxyphosphoribosylaminopyrimidine deaminase/5-amino-6-(5-phosphoribosylamino)uracil reductase RibD n=1 Tax=Paraglaciecola sp. TaxID=1920173 RepID=UPI00273DAC3F|nr:bifunctional diaminohydroxyphosphoribosylaminopyrimidine deaminase/5-amino-6-(5-phosphoribosylamino)uracil reductase RibD [Paraglaciecola sp.]MDP5030029.1 bifunctional diaminohydroxyphosphoribosylaminopyrimidine deaminase/5-amino-6-(5-phosphoribosylamino)uracil reductase RibD [Paraglaciecola sp.]MDP5041337.1 bifunctional diaminohydroxyphosphoribosylaminopyrimidine deaminase/5-amino-6-(5-phosphoribosylamino)uracil reductase RibD [Paraglaciecola sp.]MDP5130875.1 bifunctional diaminohydroxyphosp
MLNQFNSVDARMMALAIQLAKRGQYTTTPNPNVGCVLVNSQGNIVGQGWHQKAGTPHAEVHALKEAGSRAKGATAYVTLEPCSHFGRTPPCANALIEAGVSRVVAAMVDPNPLVAGSGLAKLTQAGISTAHGLMQTQAESLNRGFIKRMRTGRPWVTVKLAASLDGKTALANGQSKWITGPMARQDVQRHRARSCAILSGSGTVLADNPALNVRYAELGLDETVLTEANLIQPRKVILDGRNQLTPDLTCLQSTSPTLLINSRPNPLPFFANVTQYQAPAVNNQLDLHAVFNYLGSQQINNLWVEAGGKLAGALLQSKLIDELILYQAPKLMGSKGQDLFDIAPLTSMQQAYSLSWSDVRQIGTDLKLTATIAYE